jgi:hypothetical protein
LVAAGTLKKRIVTGGEKERKNKEKGLRIDKVRNISSFLSFLELDCIGVSYCRESILFAVRALESCLPSRRRI